MIIDLKKLGEVTIASPKLATCLEFVSLWATVDGDISMLARICAGAIGVCVDHTKKLPKYKPAHHNPKEYGYLILNRLLESGVASTTIYTEGTKCLSLMSSSLPTDEGIEEKTDFLPSADLAVGNS